MTPQDRHLLRKLIAVLAVKAVMLAGLWWGFVREQRVVVDPHGAAQRMLQPHAAPDAPSTPE